ncbi:MAG TPA: lytic transglycosylase domain-containing protein [Nitrospiraceae bacterium]|nr:lytic transglycosylase domain-containing protein [Nitrospiraceae bacterium]
MTTWLRRTLVLSGLCMMVTLPIPTGAQPQSEHSEAKESTPRSAANGEPEREVILLDPLENPNEPEDRLVILPEIKREGERYFLSSFKLPDKLTFAGQTVPLDNWQVRERIEYEFYQFLEDQGESIILAKRTGRCFPPAEKQLADAGLPDDLKYMLLVESKCVAAAYSKAKASGPWQFIPSTGRRYRLKSDAVRDDRRNLEMSTEAAVKYLRYLKDFKENDWFLAMASYNAGEERIRKLIKEQKITDYWKMHGPRETMRYVPRIIAAKEIYSQPEKYLGLSKKDLYLPMETETVTVNVKDSHRALTSIAEEFGTYFLELKMLNPEFKKDVLPRGTYQMRVPRQNCPTRCFNQDNTP